MKTEKAYGFFAALRMTAVALRRALLGAIPVLVLAALSLGSCVEIQGPDDDVWNDLSGDVPIRFTTTIAAPATKTGTALPNGTTFGVFAFYQPGIINGTHGAWNASTCTPNFMFNEDVTYTALSDSYSYSPLKYWPNNIENTISFWAYSPYNDSNLTLRDSGLSSSYTNESVGIPDIRFTVTDGQTDLLVSDLVESESKQDLDEAVSFTFHHTLSLIEFKVKKLYGEGEDADHPKYTVKLKSITLNNVKYTAVHNQSTGWTAPTGAPGNMNAYSGDLVLTTSYQTLPGIMPMPQTLEDSKLRIEYTIMFSGLTSPLTNIYTIKMSDIFSPATAEWEENHHYTYSITIKPDDPIIFQVQWTSWGSPNNYHL